MKAKTRVTRQLAASGERMINLHVRFWTNNIARGAGKIAQRNAWASGVVSLERNKSHALMPLPPKPFHSLMGLAGVIEDVLIAHGITLHASRKMSKYVKDRK